MCNRLSSVEKSPDLKLQASQWCESAIKQSKSASGVCALQSSIVKYRTCIKAKETVSCSYIYVKKILNSSYSYLYIRIVYTMLCKHLKTLLTKTTLLSETTAK